MSIGLFEDVEPEDLDEEKVIWSDKSQLMSTSYADWLERRSESGTHQNLRRKEILRKQQEQEKRQSSPGGPAWWEEAAPIPPREKTGMVASKEKNLGTSARREQQPRAYHSPERSKKAEADDVRKEKRGSDTSTSSLGRMYVKPPKFDGKGCVESHLLQFQVAASRNRWNKEEKADFLKISLAGDASAILKDVGEEVTYEELASKLKQCYGSLEQKEVFKIQLKVRKRKKEETLSELMRDIRRLFMQAYPAQNDVLSTSVAKDAFIDALEDKELMIRVMEREPQTLDEAYKIAERMDLYAKKVNSDDKGENKHKGNFNKVKATSVMEEGMLKSLLENQKLLQQQMISLMQSMQQVNLANNEGESRKMQEKPKSDLGFSCFGCGQEGHVKSKCPFRKNEKWESQNKVKKSVYCYKCGKEGHISTNCEEQSNKIKAANGRSAPSDRSGKKSAEVEADSVKKIGRTLYARMEINDKWLDCLIDTGSEVNLIPAKYSNNLEIQPTTRVLQAANGTCIEVLGEVELTVNVASLKLNTTFIVSEQIEEVLIGVDWWQVHECYISFPENIMSIKGQRIPLLKKMSRDRCNRVVLQQNVVIPALSEMVVPGKMIYCNLSTSNSAEHWATCTRECSPGVYGARSLMPNRSQNSPVRVLNVKNQECILLKEENLTTVEAVQPLDDVPHQQKKREEQEGEDQGSGGRCDQEGGRDGDRRRKREVAGTFA